MKLRKLFFRDSASASAAPQGLSARELESTPSDASRDAGRTSAEDVVADNVVLLHPAGRVEAAPSQSDASQAWPPVTEPASAVRYRGLLDDPEIAGFLAHSYWAFGRSHGTRAQSQHALELELEAVTAKFQNVLLAVAAKRQSKLHRARHYRLETQGGNPTLTAQLELAEANHLRDIEELEVQAGLAVQRKGWVLQAVNQFRLGFDQGVREHLEFHQIFG
jgi:hypothetical protein